MQYKKELATRRSSRELPEWYSFAMRRSDGEALSEDPKVNVKQLQLQQ